MAFASAASRLVYQAMRLGGSGTSITSGAYPRRLLDEWGLARRNRRFHRTTNIADLHFQAKRSRKSLGRVPSQFGKDVTHRSNLSRPQMTEIMASMQAAYVLSLTRSYVLSIPFCKYKRALLGGAA
ncbi:hypothetical protein [Massilia sp. TWR1-2-2]|uniref:hypothetical protein n=1 Tax=Massilia sp. TWR1-2-2 TaxID=2804584 RepID=UPI003CF90C9C